MLVVNVQIDINQELKVMQNVCISVNLVDIVKVFNVFGVNFQDLIVIFQVMKVVGVLCVEFEVI